MIEEILTDHADAKGAAPAGELLKFGVQALLSARPYHNHLGTSGRAPGRPARRPPRAADAGRRGRVQTRRKWPALRRPAPAPGRAPAQPRGRTRPPHLLPAGLVGPAPGAASAPRAGCRPRRLLPAAACPASCLLPPLPPGPREARRAAASERDGTERDRSLPGSRRPLGAGRGAQSGPGWLGILFLGENPPRLCTLEEPAPRVAPGRAPTKAPAGTTSAAGERGVRASALGSGTSGGLCPLAGRPEAGPDVRAAGARRRLRRPPAGSQPTWDELL